MANKQNNPSDKTNSQDSITQTLRENSLSGRTVSSDEVLLPKVIELGFTLGPYIGSGQYSKVYKVQWSQMPDKELVIKCLKLGELDDEWREKCLKNEMKVLKKLADHSNHPNIIKTYKFIKTRNLAYIVMEYANNGNIAHLLEKRGKPFKESKLKLWFTDLFSALTFVHRKGIAHRDLKPNNFLLRSDKRVLLTGFGFSCSTLDKESTRLMKGTQCGSAHYMAPEVHALIDNHVYDTKAADVYSMGVSLFELINYIKPFEGNIQRGDKKVIEKQTNRDYKLLSRVELKVSKKCKDFIHKLLEPDPQLRITAQQALEHHFIKAKLSV